ncbi:Sec-independent protein translocase protein TatA [Frankia sp. AiPs1]|uniref:Sec-independent protein translocase subunit TatA n=1 Tax=Frankia sp. AiPa1 TaxID=573492 RepID=UPI00202B56BC|nr:Sec-independent protein translocase subunit TatA [Frankia sp. AiPa1]MCL9758826.1 Sec-independent protein translocase subunit TatA [Frankia sp. AiPa1]
MGDIGAPELLIILVVIMVLFGAKRLPDAARSFGRSLRIFKSEVKGLHEDDKPAAEPVSPAQTPAPAPAAVAAPIAVAAPAPAVPVTAVPSTPAQPATVTQNGSTPSA